jgi:hypothetical protein
MATVPRREWERETLKALLIMHCLKLCPLHRFRLQSLTLILRIVSVTDNTINAIFVLVVAYFAKLSVLRLHNLEI